MNDNKQLWTDERIGKYVNDTSRNSTMATLLSEAMVMIRDDLTAQLAAAQERVKRLEQQLETASHNAKHYADLSLELQTQLATKNAVAEEARLNAYSLGRADAEAQLAQQPAMRYEPVPQSLEYDLLTYAMKHGELPQEYTVCRKVEGESHEPLQNS